ncbi:Cleavage stimulation factor 50 kDa subunit [Caenorhabditis elegans]|uniref:Cleavage stimulation factor 50 kDa subunit n=1 Tax=Caenorhabditis elegans TaxID=6239 RepID=Q19864_CAEEL|nr:Cleavage stimulation factor 50 kDa subunit [Caenorhabditis elegans]CAA92670.1 Cleavage stimulation factor 50 kDa subunit [Caenorhabditis elegans]|eukprot:NP_495822.1 Cleavage and Polyadenylation Factor [Caenorhabditis elegans]
MKPDIKDREYMYRLIIGQLFYDGHQQIAVNLANTLGCSAPAPPPSDKLFRLVTIAKQFVEDPDYKAEEKSSPMQFEPVSSGLDLEYDADVQPVSSEPSEYETIYLTVHKAPCRAAAFNSDGSLVATGSADCSIKIMDVERILAREKEHREMNENGPDAHHPVIRTLYDHVDDVNTVIFHPRDSILISGSNDKTVKLFDFSKTAVKKAMKTLSEVYPVRALSCHPGGEFLLVATDHPTVRLYNIETAQAYASANPDDQHTESVTDVHYSENARLYVTASKDGHVKIWDGVSNRCVETFKRAHDGSSICSAKFTKNGKYILTSGMDSIVKLWELSTNRCLIVYTGAGATGAQDFATNASFNHNEDYVLFPDEKSGSMCSWDARNSDRKRLLALGHTSACRTFVHSPSMPAFMTGSDDHRARFWYRKPATNEH